MWTQRLVMSPLLLLWILSACNPASDAPSRASSSDVDSWSDPHNVYKYLKTSTGQCLYQGADCSSLEQFSVTQFKTVSGFNGIPFGAGQNSKLDINADGTLDDVDKYSGNLATYTAKHSPNAVRNGLFTYFTYSGEVALDGFESGNSKIGTTGAVGCNFDGTQLFKNAQGTAPAIGIYVSRYNHVTGNIDVDKYSGNLATYTAKHSPNAVRNGLFTYFTYSGEVARLPECMQSCFGRALQSFVIGC